MSRPDNLAKARANTTRIRHARHEDLVWMTANGENMTGAAQRLGITRSALDHWCRRWAPDLRRVLLEREPRAMGEAS